MKDNSIFSNLSSPPSISAFLLAAVLIVLIMTNGSTTLIPIVIAIGIWLVINDITNLIHRVQIGGFQMPRALAMALGLLIILFLALRITGLMARNILVFMDALPTYTDNLRGLVNAIPAPVWTALLGADVDLSNDILSQIFDYTSDFFSGSVAALAASAANIASNALYIAVYVIFLLLEQNTFSAKARNMFSDPEKWGEFQAIMDSIHEQVQTYITVKTVVSLTTGLVSYAIMRAFGLNHAVVWAILIFILNFIPNIGSIIAVVFPVIMAILQFGSLGTVVSLVVVLTLVQVAVGYFVEPRMMGNRLNLSPFVVLVALGVFGAIWGITGMFLSVPLTVVIMIVFSHFDSTRPIAVLLSGDGIVYGVEKDTSV